MDFPTPLAPMIATTSPGSTRRSTPRKILSSLPSPDRKCFLRPRASKGVHAGPVATLRPHS